MDAVEMSRFDCVITSRCAKCGQVFVKPRVGDGHKNCKPYEEDRVGDNGEDG